MQPLPGRTGGWTQSFIMKSHVSEGLPVAEMKPYQTGHISYMQDKNGTLAHSNNLITSMLRKCNQIM